MNGTLILVCVGIGWTAFCMLIADWICSPERRIARRIRTTANRAAGQSEPASTLFRDWNLSATRKRTVLDRLHTMVEQSGLPITLRHVLLFSGWSAIVVTALGLSWSRWGWLGLLAAGLPTLFVSLVRRRRIALMQRQLPEAFDVMRRAVEAGQTVTSAFAQVSSQCPVPLSAEFALCGEQQNLGLSHDAAMRDLVRRVPAVEIRMLVVALILQRQSGGSPTDILNNMAELIRKRQRLGRRVQALTAEGRSQAFVLTLLPILTFAGLLLLQPEYVSPLVERPRILMLMVALEVIGALWVRQTIQLEY